ncbi:hypothetical protein MTO96_022829 [Rhipicephalus appendiculatus]
MDNAAESHSTASHSQRLDTDRLHGSWSLPADVLRMYALWELYVDRTAVSLTDMDNQIDNSWTPNSRYAILVHTRAYDKSSWPYFNCDSPKSGNL